MEPGGGGDAVPALAPPGTARVPVPNPHFALVDRAKIEDYLLSPTHRRGRTKRRFFVSLGYTRAAWPRLAEDLKDHLLRHPVLRADLTVFGTKYIVRGSLHGPSGSAAIIVSVWIILPAEDFPRFVTAYPGERR
ncbi:MAG: DUF6883 domain-containing protein [Candidatus Binatia bacterium]